MKCRKSNIDTDNGNSLPDFKSRHYYRKFHYGLLEKCMKCMGNLFNGLHSKNKCV